ncbi:MAG: DUF1302 domain-containing protein [Dechloromonas sp.]|nr:DUF1302 domain-containing protein [Dechloromonas sp.]
MRNETRHRQWNRMRPVALVMATMLGAGGNAQAFNIDVDNEDIEIRWDNTIRYNAGVRVKNRDNLIGNNIASDEGTYLFDKGDLVTNRVDLFSEFDFAWKKTLGFRVSAAGWYDAAYGDDSGTNPKFASISSYPNQKFSNYTKRFYEGPSGEILDAFVFANFDVGETPVKVRAGRHTVFWGESLFLGGALHGISYSQMPLDLQKGFATPGVEAKELFRPLNQVSGQVQVTDNLSLAAQYFLEWEAYRYPEGGTYLGPVDFAFNGPERVLLAPGVGYTRGNPFEPDQRNGEFGLNARWSPEGLDGTVGVYYRRYADKLPQGLVTQQTLRNVGTAARPNFVPLSAFSQYNLIYADGIDLYGVSFAKNIGGISFGSELSYRHNTPLLSKILGVPGTNPFNVPVPGEGQTTGPRGNTIHGLVNAVGIVPDTPVFDGATWAVELVWSQWLDVTSGAETFQAVGYKGCTFGTYKPVGDKWDGCATKNYVGMGASFTPTWYQVMPGVDMSAPLTFSMGLSGNAATTFGGNQGNGNFSAGLGFDIFQKHRVDLKYIGYFGRINDYGTSGALGAQNITQNGFTTLLKDRDFISLTLKTTF